MMRYPKLLSATANDDFSLSLAYEDGEKRIYDFRPNLSHKYYSSLADIALFKTVRVIDGEIEWLSGQDFCPHTLYDESVVLK